MPLPPQKGMGKPPEQYIKARALKLCAAASLRPARARLPRPSAAPRPAIDHPHANAADPAHSQLNSSLSSERARRPGSRLELELPRTEWREVRVHVGRAHLRRGSRFGRWVARGRIWAGPSLAAGGRDSSAVGWLRVVGRRQPCRRGQPRFLTRRGVPM